MGEAVIILGGCTLTMCLRYKNTLNSLIDSVNTQTTFFVNFMVDSSVAQRKPNKILLRLIQVSQTDFPPFTVLLLTRSLANKFMVYFVLQSFGLLAKSSS